MQLNYVQILAEFILSTEQSLPKPDSDLLSIDILRSELYAGVHLEIGRSGLKDVAAGFFVTSSFDIP